MIVSVKLVKLVTRQSLHYIGASSC